jgi:hypothetical protein
MKFYNDVRNKIGPLRQRGFDYIFEYLKTIKNPLIVETGCAREENNYEGDGQSSLLFDQYTKEYGGQFYTVDISKESVKYCRSKMINEKSSVNLGDSILYLKELNKWLLSKNEKIDFLYLDSFDAPKNNPDTVLTSALHHLYEFTTILPSLKPGCLIGVDDCWPSGDSISGKGTFVAEYMNKINIKPSLVFHQTFWKLL